MSALLPKADIRQRIEYVCFVPITDILAVVWHDELFANLKAFSWVVVFLWLGSRMALASYSWGRSPGRCLLWGFFCICNTSPSHFLPLAKSLDRDRAQVETSLAGVPHHRRYQ